MSAEITSRCRIKVEYFMMVVYVTAGIVMFGVRICPCGLNGHYSEEGKDSEVDMSDEGIDRCVGEMER